MTSDGRRDASDRVLGADRVQRLEAVQRRVETMNALTDDAFAAEVLLIPLDLDGFGRLRDSLRWDQDESWVFVASESEGRYLAMDEATDLAVANPAEATIYTPIHTQLVSWWLFHAWRSADLLSDAIENLRAWRPYPAAVLSRAVIEQCGCMLYEARKIVTAWHDTKVVIGSDHFSRVNRIRSTFTPLLNSAALGTRLSAMDGRGMKATNVLTYVDKLDALLAEADIRGWYDWLSDAAHPAFGARIAGSSDAFMHESRAVTLRYHDRSPLHLEGPTGVTRFQYPIATYAADAVAACGFLLMSILDQMLKIVDDFGLTTAAASFTTRSYWRNYVPTRGTRPCPCGRGTWAACAHWWGGSAPTLRVDASST